MNRTLLVLTSVMLAACGGDGSTADGSATSDEPSILAEGVYGQAPSARNGVPSVVVMAPAAGTESEAGAPTFTFDDPVIDQFGLVFSPTELVVEVGATLLFTNSESALTHNVQVWDPDAEIMLLDSDALPGDRIEITLTDVGGYDILCDEHPGMRAFVFVTESPYAVFAETDGAFELGVAPAGDYLARVWTVDDGFGPEVPISVAELRTGVDMRPAG
jgi:plastocyanin